MAVDQLSKKNPDGTTLGQSTSDKVGFYGATTIVQPASPSGNTHTPTAGSTTFANRLPFFPNRSRE